jgi:hypothetical protein
MRVVGVAVWLVAWVLSACDPIGPGATGNVTVAPHITRDKYTFLYIAAFEDSGDPFDLRVHGPWHDLGVPSTATPRAFMAGANIGRSNKKAWRVVAWLEAQELEYGASRFQHELKPGTPYGTTIFELGFCTLVLGYCDKTPAVDLVIDATVPAGPSVP